MSELSNHLANTLVTISDNKVGVSTDTNNLADFYQATVLSATDYYAFGMSMKERSWQSESYRYGFNGKEKDGDIGEETTDFGARLMNSKIGRWFAVDPLAGKYPSLSPYNFVANNPLRYVDPDGKVIRIADGVDEETRKKIENYLTILREIIPEIFEELDKPDVDVEFSVGNLNPAAAYQPGYTGSVTKGVTNVNFTIQRGLEVFDIDTDGDDGTTPTKYGARLMSQKTYEEKEKLREELGIGELTESQMRKEISLEEAKGLVSISENKIRIILDPKTFNELEKRQTEIIGH
ncbi:MAG: RHS repeat-associated core domain-containing protein, partial [Thermoflexibacter sp.]|nr:RHS repeat-associated core domain-containing protein [Thermoflexibacter sp.]